MDKKIFGSFCFHLRRRPHLLDAACHKNRRLPHFFVVFFPPSGLGCAVPFAFGWRQKQNKEKQIDGQTFIASHPKRKATQSRDSMLLNTVTGRILEFSRPAGRGVDTQTTRTICPSFGQEGL